MSCCNFKIIYLNQVRKTKRPIKSSWLPLSLCSFYRKGESQEKLPYGKLWRPLRQQYNRSVVHEIRPVSWERQYSLKLALRALYQRYLGFKFPGQSLYLQQAFLKTGHSREWAYTIVRDKFVAMVVAVSVSVAVSMTVTNFLEIGYDQYLFIPQVLETPVKVKRLKIFVLHYFSNTFCFLT